MQLFLKALKRGLLKDAMKIADHRIFAGVKTEIEAEYLADEAEDRRMKAEDLQMKMGPEKGPLSSPKRKDRFEFSP